MIAHEKSFKFLAQPQTGAYSCYIRVQGAGWSRDNSNNHDSTNSLILTKFAVDDVTQKLQNFCGLCAVATTG